MKEEAAADERAEAHRTVCALFDACREDGSAGGIRDAAVLSVLFGAEVPAETARRLPLESYDPRAAVLTWRPEGEEGRRRARRATDGAREALADWLAVRGSAPGPLLCRLEGRTDAPRPLPRGTVPAILDRWARRTEMDLPDETERLRLYVSPWWEDVPEEASGD